MDSMVKTAEVLAVIPARGGSQGIPRKNLRPLAGRPLIAWSIAAARQARLVNRVVVSTDDQEIADTACSYGAEVPFLRPAELAQNDTRDLPVFQHVIDWLKRNEDYVPDAIVQLRPTSPLRPPGLVDEAIERLLSDEAADSVRCVTLPSQNPYKMWTVTENALKPLVETGLYEPYNAPRQSLPTVYWQTGHVDVFRTRTVTEKLSLTGDRILPVMVDPRYAFDIDTLMHLRMAGESVAEGDLDLVTPASARNSALEQIRLFVFDFDGVFTDNRVYVDQSGVESVSCSRADGLGVERLLSAGHDAAVLSTEANPVVSARCRKLGIPVQQGLRDKGQALRNLTASRGLALTQVAYVGNDVNDLECLRIAGFAVAPADAHPDVRKIVDLVLLKAGGHGAVREFCDLAIAVHQSTTNKEEYARNTNR
jgi:YrbI family 3-deoxy-D-manno-octulosonate 8-phosphate phosphatase